jgi:outer membrane biosynthesis protein TonB
MDGLPQKFFPRVPFVVSAAIHAVFFWLLTPTSNTYSISLETGTITYFDPANDEASKKTDSAHGLKSQLSLERQNRHAKEFPNDRLAPKKTHRLKDTKRDRELASLGQAQSEKNQKIIHLDEDSSIEYALKSPAQAASQSHEIHGSEFTRVTGSSGPSKGAATRPLIVAQAAYPERCRAARIEGTVETQLHFRDGQLERVEILRAVPECPEFSDNSIRAAQISQITSREFFAGRTVQIKIPFRFEIIEE